MLITQRAKTVIKNQDGIAVSIMFLIIVPLMLIGLLFITEQARTVYDYDVTQQQVLSDAVRAATVMVTPASQAVGTPLLDPEQAHKAFRYTLAANLNLGIDDSFDLQGVNPESNLKEMPEYVFIVYNGPNSLGMPSAIKYPGALEFGVGIDQSFSIYENDIQPGSMGTLVTQFKSPGCVAVIKTNYKPIFIESKPGVRWAAAHIVK